MKLLLPLIVLALAPGLGSQVLFRAELDGGQEVPPVTTSAAGWASFQLNPDSSLTYDLHAWDLQGTAAHVHIGAAGQNGGILIPLNGGPTVWSGTSSPLSAAEIDLLRTEGLYVNVHTAANPGGEIRGQLTASPKTFAATIDGGQEVPPVSTAASGVATFTLNSDGSLQYEVSVASMSGIACHIHAGDIGSSGPILFDLSGGPTLWSGTTVPLTADEFSELQMGRLYVNVHSNNHPAGEIRGQILSTGAAYGPACPHPGGQAALFSEGTPRAGNTITLQIQGGIPSNSGILAASLNPSGDLFLGCSKLVALPTVQQLPFPLDGLGNGSLPIPLPMTAQDLDAYLQFWAKDPSTQQWYNSNGWKLPIRVY
ncbi:MAG: CHRD domain-containing protein [Planctomycetota bacterium]|nr:MAG: CHRD domain-containing protein [Planctomycetota bacterium]